MNLAEELLARGLIEQSSTDVERILAEPRTAYLGIDPTADSAHVGHLVPLLLMKRLGQAGFKLVFLVGGGTGMIGDPRDKGERVLLDEKTIGKNKKALQKQLKGLLGGLSFRMVDNADWLMKVKLVPFLRDIGKHFTVNDLVKRDLIKKRLETPDESISYTEFTYALLQGFDFLTLFKKYGCTLQVGATDQWTNILSGVDLIRKKEGVEAFAMVVPIVTDAAGKKFGKSEGNAVWLDPQKTTPFQFYQFWMNLPDEGIEKYFKIFTFMPLEQIEALMERHRAAPQDREAQETLARSVTELVHGPAAVAQAAAATDALFGDTPFDELSRDAKAAAVAEAPRLSLERAAVDAGVPLVDCLVEGGLASSKSDARRLIESKAIKLSGFAILNADQKVYRGDLKDGHALVRKGKQGVLLLVLK